MVTRRSKWIKTARKKLCLSVPLACFVYLDNIIIYSNTFEQHSFDMQAILDKLRKANHTINVKKALLLFPLLEWKMTLRIPKLCRTFLSPKTARNSKGFVGWLGGTIALCPDSLS